MTTTDFPALALTVSCPTCKAGVGVPCTRRMYRDGWLYHLRRIDKAVRKEERGLPMTNARLACGFLVHGDDGCEPQPLGDLIPLPCVVCRAAGHLLVGTRPVHPLRLSPRQRALLERLRPRPDRSRDPPGQRRDPRPPTRASAARRRGGQAMTTDGEKARQVGLVTRWPSLSSSWPNGTPTRSPSISPNSPAWPSTRSHDRRQGTDTSRGQARGPETRR